MEVMEVVWVLMQRPELAVAGQQVQMVGVKMGLLVVGPLPVQVVVAQVEVVQQMVYSILLIMEELVALDRMEPWEEWAVLMGLLSPVLVLMVRSEEHTSELQSLRH